MSQDWRCWASFACRTNEGPQGVGGAGTAGEGGREPLGGSRRCRRPGSLLGGEGAPWALGRGQGGDGEAQTWGLGCRWVTSVTLLALGGHGVIT